MQVSLAPQQLGSLQAKYARKAPVFQGVGSSGSNKEDKHVPRENLARSLRGGGSSDVFAPERRRRSPWLLEASSGLGPVQRAGAQGWLSMVSLHHSVAISGRAISFTPHWI